jgi:hypothetical protein
MSLTGFADLTLVSGQASVAGPVALPPADYVAQTVHENPPGGVGATAVVFATTGVGVAIGAAVLLAWLRADRRRHGRAARALARACGVGGSRSWSLLTHLSRAARLPTVGALLISEGCFDRAAQAYVERFGPSRRVEDLRARLFSCGDPAGNLAAGGHGL